MPRLRLFSALLVWTVALLACALQPAAQNPTADVNAIVSQTMAALTASVPATVTPTLAPMDEGILPQALYFLAPDAAGVTQLYRLAPDGKTRSQVTTEAADVTSYDFNLNDGRVVYVANNQIWSVLWDGSARQMLFDGGPVDDNNELRTKVRGVAWSPDGSTIAYGYNGLNLYNVATGQSTRVLTNQTHAVGGNGVELPTELYWPERYSPDGTKLLITLGYFEGAWAAIYIPASNTLTRLSEPNRIPLCCGNARWSADSSSLFAGGPTLGIEDPGLWRIDAANGQITELIPGDAGNNTFNLAATPFYAPDHQLYYFYANTTMDALANNRAPLQLVRSGADGVTGRTVLLPGPFDMMTEALWTPDASYVVVAIAQDDQTWEGGQLEYIAVSGYARVVLAPFGHTLRWGP